MYEIKIFENPDFGQVRTTTGENGTPFFCAVDVCRALGYGNSRDALRKHVMEDDVAKRDTIDSLGRKQRLKSCYGLNKVSKCQSVKLILIKSKFFVKDFLLRQ